MLPEKYLRNITCHMVILFNKRSSELYVRIDGFFGYTWTISSIIQRVYVCFTSLPSTQRAVDAAALHLDK